MNKDRRVLAWLSILFSMLCCLPLVFGAGFISLTAVVSYFDKASNWEVTDTILFSGIAILMIAAVVIGAFLIVWGVRALLGTDSGAIQPEPEQ